MQSNKDPSSRSRDGRLAECENCGMKGTDLKMCVHCKHVFGPNVKIVDNPFIPHRRPPVKRESIVKPEVLEDDLLKSPFSETVESPDSSNDHFNNVDRHVGDNIYSGRSMEVMNFEKRLRVIHVNESTRPMIFYVKSHPRDNKVMFQGATNAEDTIIEEIRKSDVPHTIRIIQITPFGAEQILKDEVYGTKLQKIIFGSPSSLDFILKLLNHASQLKAVRFGVHAFNLRDQDTESSSIGSQKFILKDLNSLEMVFDQAKYDSYDPESKEIMRFKIATILKVASTAFPNLIECDITVPELIESDLDSFLAKKANIRSRGSKNHSFIDHTFRFKVEKPKPCEKEPITSVRTDTNKKASVTTPEVVVIDLSDEDEQTPMTSSKNPKVSEKQTVKNASPVRRRSSASDLSSFDGGVEWDAGDEAFIPYHIAPCNKCGTKSKNLKHCEGCGTQFSSKLTFLKVDAPTSEAKITSTLLSEVKTKTVPVSSVSSSTSSTGSKSAQYDDARSYDEDNDPRRSRPRGSGLHSESSKREYEKGYGSTDPRRSRPGGSGLHRESRRDYEKGYSFTDSRRSRPGGSGLHRESSKHRKETSRRSETESEILYEADETATSSKRSKR